MPWVATVIRGNMAHCKLGSVNISGPLNKGREISDIKIST